MRTLVAALIVSVLARPMSEHERVVPDRLGHTDQATTDQGATIVVRGKVSDPSSGLGIPAVTIRVTAPATAAGSKTMTDSVGWYALTISRATWTGSPTLQAARPGFVTITRYVNVRSTAADTVRIDVLLWEIPQPLIGVTSTLAGSPPFRPGPKEKFDTVSVDSTRPEAAVALHTDRAVGGLPLISVPALATPTPIPMNKTMLLQGRVAGLHVIRADQPLVATPVVVRGTVADATTGQRLPGVTVDVWRPDDATRWGTTTTDSGGLYALTVPRSAWTAPLTVQAMRIGLGTGTRSEPRPGATVDTITVDLRMQEVMVTLMRLSIPEDISSSNSPVLPLRAVPLCLAVKLQTGADGAAPHWGRPHLPPDTIALDTNPVSRNGSNTDYRLRPLLTSTSHEYASWRVTGDSLFLLWTNGLTGVKLWGHLRVTDAGVSAGSLGSSLAVTGFSGEAEMITDARTPDGPAHASAIGSVVTCPARFMDH